MTQAGGVQHDEFIYTYDANGNILSISEGSVLKATYGKDKGVIEHDVKKGAGPGYYRHFHVANHFNPAHIFYP